MVAEYLPSMPKILGSIPRGTEKKENEKERKGMVSSVSITGGRLFLGPHRVILNYTKAGQRG